MTRSASISNSPGHGFPVSCDAKLFVSLVLYSLGTGAAAHEMRRHDTSLTGIKAEVDEIAVRCLFSTGDIRKSRWQTT
jgi:hypothetical protein